MKKTIVALGLASLAMFPAAGAQNSSPGLASAVEQWTAGKPLYNKASLLKAWIAAEQPEVPGDRRTSVEAAIRDRYKLTGKTRPPAAVARCSPAAPVFKLDFGPLPVGCYVVRVIALAKTEDLDRQRKPILLDFKVNDQVGGGEGWYRHRVPYWDDFYCVADFFFNAEEARAYRGTLTVAEGSLADLYIHSVELHDCLRGQANKAAKAKPGLFTYAERERLRATANRTNVIAEVSREVALDPFLRSGDAPLAGEARRRRDDLLWNAVPPLNMQFIAEYDEGFLLSKLRPGAMTAAEARKQYGSWELDNNIKASWFTPFALVNKTLGLTYGLEALRQYRPLPDPYPFKDTGHGVYFPKKSGMENPEQWMPIAALAGAWSEGARLPLAPYHGGEFMRRLPFLYHALGDERAARDAALILCKWASMYPGLTDDLTLGFAVFPCGDDYKRDTRLIQRRFGYQRFTNLMTGLLVSYDLLFDYIKGNQELAGAVGRYLPWIKTEEDVRTMIESRLTQFAARQVMSMHRWNDKGTPAMLMEAAAVQQDPAVTRPWMEHLWSSIFLYPFGSAGLPDFIASDTQRDGSTSIGSIFYSWEGSPFQYVVDLSARYVKNGGDAKYDLSDMRQFRKLCDAHTFPLDASVAGGYPMTIGDVGSPSKPRGFIFLSSFEDLFRSGYPLLKDQRLAWLLVNYFTPRGETEAEWQAIQEAALRQGRNPFLAQQSRVLANWAGILESGRESDDFRFKRTAQVRVGTGHGHAHQDTLDFQLLAHGVRLVNDVGYRGEYTSPGANSTILHNLVEVNGDINKSGNWQGHAWIGTLVPADGLQYLEATAIPPAPYAMVTHRSRAVALIDADAGTPGAAAPKPLPYTHETVFDPAAVTPNSYVFDVQRVAGGERHTFCFHGCQSEQFTVNPAERGETFSADEEQYLRRFLKGPGMRFSGRTPALLTATWQLRRSAEVSKAVDRDGNPIELRQDNAEKIMLGANFLESAPPKFTRLYLADHPGERLLVASFTPKTNHVQHTWPFLMIQQNGTNLQSVYPAIIEPYAGEPFITGVRSLPIPGNDRDALRAVALEVKLRNGRTDVCFSDGRPKTRQVESLTVNGRYAYVSMDKDGLRAAQLVGGTELKGPWGRLVLAKPDLTARVIKADYWKRQVWLDQSWPTNALAGAQVEVGNDRHRTSFTVTAVQHENGQTRLTFDKAMDLGYSHVVSADPEAGLVGVTILPLIDMPGMKAGLTCSNADNSKTWKCRLAWDQKGMRYAVIPETAFTAEDFPAGSVLRLWECGAGDEARLSAYVTARRAADGKFTLESNLPLPASTLPR